jgi:hypothetical protein
VVSLVHTSLLSSSPHAHIFVLGTAVINTHTILETITSGSDAHRARCLLCKRAQPQLPPHDATGGHPGNVLPYLQPLPCTHGRAKAKKKIGTMVPGGKNPPIRLTILRFPHGSGGQNATLYPDSNIPVLVKPSTPLFKCSYKATVTGKLAEGHLLSLLSWLLGAYMTIACRTLYVEVCVLFSSCLSDSLRSLSTLYLPVSI